MTLSNVLTGVGFIAALLAVFPLGYVYGISRDAQFLAGVIVMCLGLALMEMREKA